MSPEVMSGGAFRGDRAPERELLDSERMAHLETRLGALSSRVSALEARCECDWRGELNPALHRPGCPVRTTAEALEAAAAAGKAEPAPVDSLAGFERVWQDGFAAGKRSMVAMTTPSSVRIAELERERDDLTIQRDALLRERGDWRTAAQKAVDLADSLARERDAGLRRIDALRGALLNIACDSPRGSTAHVSAYCALDIDNASNTSGRSPSGAVS